MDYPKYAERQTLEAKRFAVLTAEEARQQRKSNHLAANMTAAADVRAEPFTHLAALYEDYRYYVYAGYSDRHDATFTRIF